MNGKGCGSSRYWPSLKYYHETCLEGLRKSRNTGKHSRCPVRFEPETSRIHVRRFTSRAKLHGDDPLTVKCDYEFCMAFYGRQSDVEVGLFKSCLASLWSCLAACYAVCIRWCCWTVLHNKPNSINTLHWFILCLFLTSQVFYVYTHFK
jgi:hypothetical protein